MGKISEVAERFWSGDLSAADRHPWAALHELEELEAGIAFVSTFANVTAFESLHDQTVAMMNAGARLDDIVHSVRAPAHLLARPHLQPVYDEPEFVVRNVWRLYDDGNPGHLKPAPEAALAAELARLAGGAGRLADRAAALAAEGGLALACQLAELAAEAAPADAAIRAVRSAVYTERADRERSAMAKGIYRWAAGERGD